MSRILVSQSASWNPTHGCWEYVDVYWEDEFPMDNEWLDDNCFIARTEWVLWRETSCFDQNRDRTLVLRERSRESQQSYVLAQHYCKEQQGDVRVEPGQMVHPVNETWKIESEFWKRN